MSDVEVVKHLLYTYRTLNIILSHSTVALFGSADIPL